MYIRGKKAYKVYYRENLTAVIVGKVALKRRGKNYKVGKLIYYGPSVISVTVTKRGHLRGGGLYKTSKTMG